MVVINKVLMDIHSEIFYYFIRNYPACVGSQAFPAWQCLSLIFGGRPARLRGVRGLLRILRPVADEPA
ncbi:MAG: hypothetical protein AUK28_05330 [Desulfobacterales bacterium CG2_30_60_27]|nr:MAG: hypothetical protein AUK28_05330 [Desulfobacterales bacterium CG2_30_60_27]